MVTTTEAARVLAAQRKVTLRQCVVCGKEMEGTSRKKYCGNTCMVRAYRERKQQAQSDR